MNLESLNFISALARGGHSNRLCTNTRDRGQELGQAVKAENLEGQAVKRISQIRKSQGSSTVKGQTDTKSHQSTIPHLVERVRSRVKGLFEWRSSGQGPNSRSKILTAVAGVSTESIGVTSPCLVYKHGVLGIKRNWYFTEYYEACVSTSKLLEKMVPILLESELIPKSMSK